MNFAYPGTANFENPAHLSESDAKNFLQNMRLVGVEIIEIDISFFDIQNWYAETSPYAQLAGIRYTYQRLKSAVERIAGFELPTTQAEDELIRGSADSLRMLHQGGHGAPDGWSQIIMDWLEVGLGR